jgi:hypothetical protein
MRFGLVIGFDALLKLVTAMNFSDFAISHILKFTAALT